MVMLPLQLPCNFYSLQFTHFKEVIGKIRILLCYVSHVCVQAFCSVFLKLLIVLLIHKQCWQYCSVGSHVFHAGYPRSSSNSSRC